MSDFGKKNQQQCQFWVSFCLKNLFQEQFFLLKKNKQFANCLKIPCEFLKAGKNYVPLTKKFQRGWKNWILCLRRFFSKKTVSFLANDCLQKLFSKLGWMFFGVWQKNFNRLSKLYLYLSREASSGENFTWKKLNSLINFQKSSGVFLENLKKMDFWRSLISTVVTNGFYISRETFWGKNVSRKKIIKKKCICTLSGVLVSSYRIYLACLSKTFHRLQMKVLRKIICSNKKLFTKFIQNVERCRTLAMNLLPIVKNAFHLSTGTFREKFVFGRNINSSRAFFRNRGDFFFRDLGRKQALGRKASARLPKLESTLPKCFIKKTYFFWRDKCLGTFFQIVGGFFSDSCEKHQKIVKLIFYLSRATSPCDNFLLGN